MPARARRRWRDPASLGAKLALILTAAGIAGALGIALLLAAVILPSFNRLEGRAVQADIERTEAALADYGAAVERVARDSGEAAGSDEYLTHPTPAFEQERLSPRALGRLDVQGVAYIGADGRAVAARWRGADAAAKAAMRDLLIDAVGLVASAHAQGDDGARHFYMPLGTGVAAVGVAPVRRAYANDRSRGAVIMARVLTGSAVAGLTRLDARIEPVSQRDVTDRTVARVSVPMPGFDDRPVAFVRLAVRRDVSLLGRRMLLLAVAGSTLLLLIVLMVLRRMIARQVLLPLHHVEAHMGRVRESGSLLLLDEDGRSDEIGSLGRAFNAMLRQLNDLREQNQVQSFALGRSESAVAVMHNVRNALNPVSTILSHGIAQAPPVDRTMLERAIAELSRDDLSADRRAKLTAFVTAGVDAWSTSRDAMKRELEVGREAMTHALEIIGEQQQRAHERPPLETCDVTELVARNATIARYTEHASIAFSFPSTPCHALANRVILSQVLGNLFGNAAESIAAAGGGSGTIAVTICERDGTVTVAIRDTGEGFDAATGLTLFQRGFSTRPQKSGGLGLHWCANSMTAMNGSLRLESAGRGQGAVAVLTLRAVETMKAAA